MKKIKIFLGLGSNVGNKINNIQKAIIFLLEKIQDIQIAKFYETKAVGYENQENFINTAIKGYTDLDIQSLFEFTKEVEKKVGRIFRFKWGPREIDIDILFYDNVIYKDSNIEIPHPRIVERDFVLKPLLDLEPDFIHPVVKKSIKQLYEELRDKSIIKEI